MSSTTTFTNAPLSGPLLPIRSSPKSSVYVKLFVGHNTRRWNAKAWMSARTERAPTTRNGFDRGGRRSRCETQQRTIAHLRGAILYSRKSTGSGHELVLHANKVVCILHTRLESRGSNFPERCTRHERTATNLSGDAVRLGRHLEINVTGLMRLAERRIRVSPSVGFRTQRRVRTSLPVAAGLAPRARSPLRSANMTCGRRLAIGRHMVIPCCSIGHAGQKLITPVVKNAGGQGPCLYAVFRPS